MYPSGVGSLEIMAAASLAGVAVAIAEDSSGMLAPTVKLTVLM